MTKTQIIKAFKKAGKIDRFAYVSRAPNQFYVKGDASGFCYATTLLNHEWLALEVADKVTKQIEELRA